MEKVKKIELTNYDGYTVDHLKFNPPLEIFPDEIQVTDFASTYEEEKTGCIVNLQFEIEEPSFEIYDVDTRSSQLMDYIKNCIDSQKHPNLIKIEEKIQKAFLTIMQPKGDNRFGLYEGENYDE
jgi:hypothetical protein